jgi:phosphoribosyl-dephospho-CoA transferase
VGNSLAAGTRECSCSRHDLLRVAPPFWARTLAARSDLATVPLLEGWSDRGWPVIVRRRTANERLHLVPVGVPLPPILGKQRIALSVPEAAVLERSLPPSLWTVKQAADPDWWKTIDALVSLGARFGVLPASFGSLLWQDRTGLQYLSRQSDLDVLWYVNGSCDVASLLAGVAAIERQAPMRIDGEVVFADGSAANWRELHYALKGERSREILVKRNDGIRLLNVVQLPNMQRVA